MVLYRAFLESRPTVLGIFSLRFLVGAAFAGPLFSSLDVWLGVLIWICLTLAVYVFNGIIDIEEDRINRSSRPIASGTLTLAQAGVVVAILGLASIVGGFWLPPLMGLSVVVGLAIGWAYSAPPFRLKRFPLGLAVVATLGGLLTYSAGYLANGGETTSGSWHYLAIFAIVMSLWMGLVGQTKDLSDVEGDRIAGRKNLPVVYGEETARWAYSIAAIAIGETYFLASAFTFSPLLLSAAVMFFGSLALAMSTLNANWKGEWTDKRRPYKIFMVTQYAANLAALIVILSGAGE